MLKQQKILVVDDDPEMRLALSIRLRANNYDVCVAVDGVSAISETRRQMPDLILLDLGLPAGDGFTVLERLQSMEALAHIPVVVVSGRNRLANQERVLAARAKAFLQKPVKNSELLSTVAKILGPATMPLERSERSSTVYDLGQRIPTAV
jgi:CheY-like chemotaxis protein